MHVPLQISLIWRGGLQRVPSTTCWKFGAEEKGYEETVCVWEIVVWGMWGLWILHITLYSAVFLLHSLCMSDICQSVCFLWLGQFLVVPWKHLLMLRAVVLPPQVYLRDPWKVQDQKLVSGPGSPVLPMQLWIPGMTICALVLLERELIWFCSKGSIQAEKADSRKTAGKVLHCTHTACGHAASVLSVFATQSYLFSGSQGTWHVGAYMMSEGM